MTDAGDLMWVWLDLGEAVAEDTIRELLEHHWTTVVDLMLHLEGIGTEMKEYS